MNKVLFIVKRNFSKAETGGEQCTQNRYNILCDYFGKEQIELFFIEENFENTIMAKFIRKINLFFGYYYGINTDNIKLILKIAKNLDWIFIDISYYGILAKLIKNKFPKVNVIAFFHNIEYDYVRQEYCSNFILRYLHMRVIFYNELQACKHSDAVITLNRRDEKLMQSLYNHNANAIIPISLPDKQIKANELQVSEIPVGLFIGSNFFANIHGINWFIENVLPYVNIKLKIVGKDMDKAKLPKNEKIDVLGFVENLEEVISNADFIVSPIFQGSGMKVKTCEALMHGKNIIGTGEAFEGYDVDFEKVGAKCETAEEFITAINEFPKRFANKFNEYSRNLFLEKYNNDVTFKQFAGVFKI